MQAISAFSPPTVSDTKAKFIHGYRKPIAAIYNTVLQELLVQQHFVRYSSKYQYNEVMALGFVSVYDQVLDGLPEEERNAIFQAYIGALGENAEQYRSDAAKLEKLAAELAAGPGAAGLAADASGSEVQQVLARVAAASAEGNLAYNKFFAIGLFRLLELAGAKEPAALEKLAAAVGVRLEPVNKDLMLYKGILSKLSVAKELMRDYLAREKKKQAEREAAKAAKEAGVVAASEGAAVQA